MSVTRVDLNSFWPEMDCRLDNRSELSLYPTGMIIVFNRPFTINKVPVDPQVARLYMEEVARKFANNPHAYERTVYLRVKVRLVQFRSQWTRGQETRAEVFGRLEGYEIYADVKKQKLMYREDFLDRRIRKARERKPVVGEGAVVEAESFDDSSEQETEPEE